MGRHPPVDLARDGIALIVARNLLVAILPEIRVGGRGIGARSARQIVRVPRVRLVGNLRRHPRHDEAQILAQRQGVIEIEIRIQLGGGLAARVRGFAQCETLVIGRYADPILEFGATTLERTLAHEVDRPRHRVRRSRRQRHLRHLDPRDAVRPEPRGSEAAPAAGTRARQLHSIHRYDRHIAGKPTNQHSLRFQRPVGGRHAGEIAQKIAQAPAERIAESCRGDDILDVRRKPLLVDRDSLDIGFARRGDFVGVERHYLRIATIPRHARQLEIALDRLVGDDGHSRGLNVESGIEYLDGHVADGETGQPVGARLVREGEQHRARNRHPGVAQIGPGHRVPHAACNRARISCHGGGKYRCASRGQRENETEAGDEKNRPSHLGAKRRR